MKRPIMHINGYFDLTFFKISGREIMDDKEIEEITTSLKNGDYLIGMETKTIKSLDDLDTVLYTFKITPTIDLRYEYELEEE